MYHYEHRNGHYVLMKGDTPVPDAKPSREVAILYSDSHQLPGTVMHKHGNPKLVMAHHKRMREAYRAAGLSQEALELKVFRSDRIPVDELNKCLDICDYVGRMVEQMARTYDAEPEDSGPSL